ncbi:type II secretion system protein N [Pollutimonas bauzanensis]|nr:type II secretion system protein N [Pollutimonas bauzanensis]
MAFFHLMSNADWPAVVRRAGILAFAAGVGIWGALLFAPAPGALPAALGPATTAGSDTAAVARWFGGGSQRLRVAVTGLIAAGGDSGAALLAVNGGAAQAYRVGQALAPGVTLAAVTPKAVSIDQDGVVEQLPVPANPAAVIQGFVPVAPAAPAAGAARP